MPLPKFFSNKIKIMDGPKKDPSVIVKSITKLVKSNGVKIRALIKLFSIKVKSDRISLPTRSIFSNSPRPKITPRNIVLAIAGTALAGLGALALKGLFNEGGEGESDTSGIEGEDGKKGVTELGKEKNTSYKLFDNIITEFEGLIVNIREENTKILAAVTALNDIIPTGEEDLFSEWDEVEKEIIPSFEQETAISPTKKDTIPSPEVEKQVKQRPILGRWKEIQEDIREKEISREAQSEQKSLQTKKQTLKKLKTNLTGDFGMGRINDPGQAEHGRAIILIEKNGPMWTYRYPDQTDADFSGGSRGWFLGERFVTVIEPPSQIKTKNQNIMKNLDQNAIENPSDYLIIYNNNQTNRIIEQE
jgi:hypothetical protein